MTSATPAPQVRGLRYFYGNNILFSPKMERCNLKKSKGWFESSGCEIPRRIKKSFVGFGCFGYKKDKLYFVT